ncbi:MAG: Acyltransferase domain protein [Acidobacteria bacterium]|nr:Acyltransferase domain protein [Acidobacteriota bacterium]
MPAIDQFKPISPEIQAPPGKAAGGVRYGFVDLLRGLALVVMVETHVVNAYLPAGLRQGPFFYWLAFLNGLVAPSFLFASGYSLVLQGSRYWNDWLHFRPGSRS